MCERHLQSACRITLWRPTPSPPPELLKQTFFRGPNTFLGPASLGQQCETAYDKQKALGMRKRYSGGDAWSKGRARDWKAARDLAKKENAYIANGVLVGGRKKTMQAGQVKNTWVPTSSILWPPTIFSSSFPLSSVQVQRPMPSWEHHRVTVNNPSATRRHP